MKQLFQSLESGVTHLIDVPYPAIQKGQLIVRTSRTLVSAGTERMLVEFGKAGWIEKARQQPDKVRIVFEKIATDGLLPTLDAVRHKLAKPIPLGYCSVGTVIEIGDGVIGYGIGDRVISNGQHAEVSSVPTNLCARVPAGVSDDEAAFTVIGAIGLQSVRLAQPTLGEAVVVTGLGLIGLITVQLLRAHGCRVLGIDFDPSRLALAREFGAEVVNVSSAQDPVPAAMEFSRGRGVDAVIIAAATKSNDPVRHAALMCRKRGRIVVAGTAGLELSRADFYEKELTLQVSCSYGPGRYDSRYEQAGIDYPIGYVRWTEQRNFEAVLDMMAEKRVAMTPLISHRFDINDAEKAYSVIVGPTASLGILFEYPNASQKSTEELKRTTVRQSSRTREVGSGTQPVVAFIGAGNYAASVLMPAFRKAGLRLKTVASLGGASGVFAARKFHFEAATTDVESIFGDPEVDAVVVATRHDSHARIAVRAIKSGKHLFVEKPLAKSESELEQIVSAYKENVGADREQTVKHRVMMVGFNRRFSPQIEKIKSLISTVAEPCVFIMTINAGALPYDHWTQDPAIGGGRILGEGCHFIDLLRFLANSPVKRFEIATSGSRQDAMGFSGSAIITLHFEAGSIGTIHYLVNGHRAFPKERLEIFAGGRVLQLDNFRRLSGHGWPGFKAMNLWRQDKGQAQCVTAFIDAIKSESPAPIAFEELIEVSRVSILLSEACN